MLCYVNLYRIVSFVSVDWSLDLYLYSGNCRNYICDIIWNDVIGRNGRGNKKLRIREFYFSDRQNFFKIYFNLTFYNRSNIVTLVKFTPNK